MKREFLTGELGLSKEITDKIMAQYGESVNKLRSAAETLKGENESLNEKLLSFEKLQNDHTALEEKVLSLTAEKDKLLGEFDVLTQKLSESKLSGAVVSALSAAGAKNIKAAAALVDKKAIKIEEDGFSGLNEQIEQIKNDCGYLFYDTSMASGMRHSPLPNPEDGFTHFARAGAKLQ